MNNKDVLSELTRCNADLNQVSTIISGLGVTSTITPYLTKYAIIRSCGCIEVSFKSIIADFCSHRSKKQIKRFINKRIREGSANPSIDNIYKLLDNFDPAWKLNLKALLDSEADKPRLMTSLQSLVDARNDFAHGGSPSITITDVLVYFSDSRKIIELMDSAVI